MTVLSRQTTVYDGHLPPSTGWPFIVSMASGEFLQIEVSQGAIDVRLTVEDPDGDTTLWDHPFGLDLAETALWVAHRPGAWRGEVRAYAPEDSGPFELTIQKWRPATPRDHLRADAAASTRRHHRLATGSSAARNVALEAYGGSLEAWRRADDAASEIPLLRRMAQLHRRQGSTVDLAAGQRLLERAQALELDDTSLSASLTWDELGRIHRLRGDLPAARRAYDIALGGFRRHRRPRLEAGTLNNLATLHLIGGDLQAARRDFELALAAFVRLGDRRRQIITATNLGGVEGRAGRLDQASRHHRHALALADDEVERLAAQQDTRQLQRAQSLRDDVRQNLAVVLADLGETGQALQLYAAALDGYRGRGDHHRAAAALASRGGLLLQLGEPESARQQLLEAQGLVDRRADPRSLARIALNLGVAWRDTGDFDAAAGAFEDSLALHRQLPDPSGEAEVLFQQGLLAFLAADFGRAESLATGAVARAEVGSSAAVAGRARRLLGQVLAARWGDAPDAALRRRTLDALEAAVEAARRSGGVAAEALAHLELGRLHHREQDFEAAEEHLGRAIVRFEQLRSNLSAEGLARSLFASVRQAYELRIDALMQRHARRSASGLGSGGLAQRAFDLADQAKARHLVAVLGRSRNGSPGARFRHGPEALRRQEEELRHRLVGLTYRRRGSGSEDEAAQIDHRIASLLAEYRLLEVQLEDGSEPPAAAATPGAAIPAAADRRLASYRRLLDEGSVLLAFSLGDERSYGWRLAPSSGGPASFETCLLPPRGVLEDAARRLHRHLSRLGDSRAEQRRAIDHLRSLLAPCLDGVAPERWLVVADGALAQVPLAVLVDPQAEIVQLPSLRVLQEIRRRPAAEGPLAGDLAVVADPLYGADDPRLVAPLSEVSPGSGFVGLPRLPWSGQEAATLGRLAVQASRRVTLVSGHRAHRDALLGGDLLHHRVLHVATHTWLDERRPELSALVLSPTPDGRSPLVPVIELADLPLRCRMVVLSGCSTASGVDIRGEGLVGLSHAFLRAGSEQVIASLWPLDDRAGALFMEEFYRAMWMQERMPSAALAQARTELRRRVRYKDPYFWAAFTLIGNWRDNPWAAP